MKHLHAFQSSAIKRRHRGEMDRQRFPGGNVQAVTPLQQCRVMGGLSVSPWPGTAHLPLFQTRVTRTPGAVGLLLQALCRKSTALPVLPSCLGSVTQAFIAWSAHGTQVPDQPVLHHVPSTGVAALERALDHNPAWPPSSITTNLFLHPTPTYQICSHPINQPSPVSCMEGWYLRSLLHHNALRHNYTPLKCTQHLLHHERCTKNMIREG